MALKHLARSDVVTADGDRSVGELASMMDDHHVGCIVVIDGDEPVGIVTDRDLATRVIGAGRDPSSLTAADVMTDDPVTIGENDGFYQATELMGDHGVRRLPVTDDDGGLAGIITADDLQELLADEHAHLAGVIQAQRPPY